MVCFCYELHERVWVRIMVEMPNGHAGWDDTVRLLDIACHGPADQCSSG